MMNWWIERDGLDKLAKDLGFGLAVFSPLYQGFLTDRYLNGVPENSRIGKGNTWIAKELNEKMLAKLNALNTIAQERGQELAQMALSWVLSNESVTTVLVGASSPEQIMKNVACVSKLTFTDEEKERIESVLNS